MPPPPEALPVQPILRLLLGEPVSAAEFSAVDWDLCARLGKQNAVLIRFAERLAAVGVRPPARFADVVEGERARGQAALDVLRHVRRTGARHRVAWLLPKATQRFPDLGDDLDLLVRARTVGVDRVLLEGLPVIRQPRTLAHRLAGTTVYTVLQGGIALDIHHGRVGNAGEHTRYPTHLVESGRLTIVGGTEVFTPSPEDQLVLQGLEKVAGRRAFHLSDVVHTVGTLRAEGLDWDYVIKTARAHGGEAGLCCYLSYVDEIHRRVVGRPLLLPEVQRTLRIDGWGRVDFRDGAFRFPAFRVSGRLYARQLVANVRSGRWGSAGRLCLLPFVAAAALARRAVRLRSRR
jgi:hypothetical protein